MLSQEDKEKVDRLIDNYHDDPGLLISVLQEVQDTFGYLSPDVLVYLAQKLRVSESEIWGIVTFYAQFYLEPRGKHTIRVCLGTACHVRGAARIVDEITTNLGTSAGETTKDGQFTLEVVNCVGACAIGPVMAVDGKYYGHMSASKVRSVLGKYGRNEG